jgi:hypothetical protein
VMIVIIIVILWFRKKRKSWVHILNTKKLFIETIVTN